MIVDLEKGQFVADCPLCGTEAKLHTNNDRMSQASWPQFWVKCDNPACRCTTIAYESSQDALAMWNRRHICGSDASKSD